MYVVASIKVTLLFLVLVVRKVNMFWAEGRLMRTLFLWFCSFWVRKWPFQCWKWRVFQAGIDVSNNQNQVMTAISANRKKYKVFSQDYAGKHLMISGNWEPYVTMTLERVLEAGDTFIDVGANFGYFTVMASGVVGKSGNVLSFECNPNIVRLLQENIELNECENVTLFEHALGDENGERNFFLSSEDTGHCSLDQLDRSQKISVKINKFDDLSLNYRVKLIKIDVEGAELRVLKGMSKLLSSPGRPYVICEMSNKFESRGGDSVQGIMEFMHKFGYKAEFIPLNQVAYPPFNLLPKHFEVATTEKILCSKDMRDVLFIPVL